MDPIRIAIVAAVGLVLATSVWVLIDARLRRVPTRGNTYKADTGALAWFLGCLLALAGGLPDVPGPPQDLGPAAGAGREVRGGRAAGRGARARSGPRPATSARSLPPSGWAASIRSTSPRTSPRGCSGT